MKIMPHVTFEYRDDELKSAYIQPIGMSSPQEGYHIVLPSNKNSLAFLNQNSKSTLAHSVRKNFLERAQVNSSLLINEDKFKYIETMEKHIKSMYVLNFVQNEEIFDYLKSLAEEDEEKEKYKLKKNNYIHMIIQNPKNITESLEVGLKIVDLTLN